jgi:hypothetical protein
MQVNSARVNCLVRTLVSVLSASVSCCVVRPDGDAAEEMLCVGSSVSPLDCRELLRSCAALVEKLGDCGGEIFVTGLSSDTLQSGMSNVTGSAHRFPWSDDVTFIMFRSICEPFHS